MRDAARYLHADDFVYERLAGVPRGADEEVDTRRDGKKRGGEHDNAEIAVRAITDHKPVVNGVTQPAVRPSHALMVQSAPCGRCRGVHDGPGDIGDEMTRSLDAQRHLHVLGRVSMTPAAELPHDGSAEERKRSRCDKNGAE